MNRDERQRGHRVLVDSCRGLMVKVLPSLRSRYFVGKPARWSDWTIEQLEDLEKFCSHVISDPLVQELSMVLRIYEEE